MWTREELKNSAKTDLKGFYWLSLGVSLIFGIFSRVTSGFSNYLSYIRRDDPDRLTSFLSLGRYDPNSGHFNEQDFGILLLMLFLFLVLVFVFIFVYSSFVTGPLSVGENRFYVHRNPEDRTIGTLFSVFKKGDYIRTVKTMFMRDLIVSLWTMLLIIPGIIKVYTYFLVPYIISDHPEMEYKETMALSAKMTEGEKGDMFILNLSFIGWYMLNILTCGIGVIFLSPYVEATWAQFYKKMCEKISETPPIEPIVVTE